MSVQERSVAHASSIADGTFAMRLAQQACACWRELNDGQLHAVKIRENAVFQVTNPAGLRYALRIHRPGYHSDLSLSSEFRWMAALRAQGLLTPRLVRSGAGRMFEKVTAMGQSYQIDVFDWIEGSSAPFPPGGGKASVDQITARYRMMGETMRLAHRQSRNWVPTPPFERHSWDVEGLTGEYPLWGRFWEYEALDEPQRALMAVLRSTLRRQLTEFGQARDRFGLIHADLMPDNVIVAPEGLCVIDFDDAGFGWYLYDIAVSLFSFTQHPDYERIFEAFMIGYQDAPASGEQREYLTMFLAARGATLLGWLHSRNQEESRARAPWLIRLASIAAERYLATRA